MSKLNPNAQKWVDALRSGKYKQARDKLKRGRAYCCLGVACEISKKDTGCEWDSEDKFDGERGRLPQSVRDWLGINSGSGTIRSVGSLAMLNDDGDSFKEIARMIEEHAEELGVSA